MDPKGENICFEVIDNIKKELPEPVSDYIFRAKYNSLSLSNISESYENIIYRPIEHLSLSYDALNTIDLKIRSAFTTYLTRNLFEKYPVLESFASSLTYDTCQTAALGLIVERAERIAKFVPEQYFKINILIKQSNTGFKTYELKWKREVLYDDLCTKVIMEDMKRERKATVVDIAEKEESIPPPLPLNTNKMLKIASTNFGMSPSDTLKILENLYLNGYISYFQTESTNYGPKFDIEEVLSAHQLHSEWGQYALNLIEKGYIKPTNGFIVDGNLPLVPVKSAEKGKLNVNEWKVYQFITKNFLASVSKPAIFAVYDVTFNISGELFGLDSKTLSEANFFQIMPWLNTVKNDEDIGRFKLMTEYMIDTRRVIDTKTLPPNYLTEAELITEMEAYKIGRNGKISQHIQDLVDNEYIQVNKKKNRALIPTKIGTAIVKAFSTIDKEMISPKIRAEIEKECELISYGELNNVEVVNHILSSFRTKFDHFVKNFDKAETIFHNEVIKPISGGKEVNKVQESKENPKGKGKGKKKDSISFPEDVMSYEHCTVYEDHKEPQEKKDPVLRCRMCNAGTLKELPSKIAISTSVTLKCNGCKKTLKCFKDYEKFEITKKNGCSICGVAQVKLNYAASESPFPMYANQHVGCIYCDEVIKKLVEFPDKLKDEIEENDMKKEDSKVDEEKLKPKSNTPVIIVSKKKGRKGRR